MSENQPPADANPASERIAELSSLIAQYQASYYNGEAEISDSEFDALWDELKSLDPQNAVLRKIGADSGNFAKTKHKMPMGSQEKAANPEEFLKWAEKHAYGEYLVEYKLDGASLELQYADGHLVCAVTRGDGEIGDDITANARKMKGVLGTLSVGGVVQKLSGAIRGEVIMTRAVHKEFFSDKANCRNAANGLMRRKDGEGSEHLCVIVYDALFTENQPFCDEEAKIRWLSACGFSTVPLEICKTAESVVDYRVRVMELRASLEYDIDGLVIKERTLDFADAARARPDRQIAFKFSLEEAVTVIRAVEWSESGATYTPIALFDPVELAGTTVKRASLVNPNTIRALGVKVGSHVVVTKRGEIIPKVERVLAQPFNMQTSDLPLFAVPETDIVFPKNCTVCGSALADGGTRLYCPNKSCPKRVHHQLEKWIAVLDVRDFGETLIKNLFQAGRVRSVSDLYTLTLSELTPFFLMDESIAADKKSKGAEKVLKSLLSRTDVPLAAFVAGFDIEGIGETLVEKLVAAGFDDLEKLLSADSDSLSAVNGFGDITASALVAGLSENKDEMRRLIETGSIRIKPAAASGGEAGIFAGKSFCFTGELHTMKRGDAERLAKEAGGSVKSAVAKGLSYLVTNDTESGSSKNKKAAELGIPIIDEKTFLEMLVRAN